MITPITTTSPTSADTTIYSITDTDAKSATTSPSSGTALDDAIANARPLLANGAPTKARVCVLWATAKKARDGATVGEIMAAFMALAVETGLIDATGNWGADIRESRRRYGGEDVAHVLRWALRGWNPFEEGPLE
ncbi:MAG TPA: hypothetical protein VGZ89_07335 [Xanthobacteraceae bacterium]|jgi:hypothetical protein|nr:hypothetical protein [Xanthobacteraceae bacterium]